VRIAYAAAAVALCVPSAFAQFSWSSCSSGGSSLTINDFNISPDPIAHAAPLDLTATVDRGSHQVTSLVGVLWYGPFALNVQTGPIAGSLVSGNGSNVFASLPPSFPMTVTGLANAGMSLPLPPGSYSQNVAYPAAGSPADTITGSATVRRTLAPGMTANVGLRFNGVSGFPLPGHVPNNSDSYSVQTSLTNGDGSPLGCMLVNVGSKGVDLVSPDLITGPVTFTPYPASLSRKVTFLVDTSQRAACQVSSVRIADQVVVGPGDTVTNGRVKFDPPDNLPPFVDLFFYVTCTDSGGGSQTVQVVVNFEP
jgi:hypothetical protein